MNKLDLYYWYATCEMYHGGTTLWERKGSVPGHTRDPSREELDNYFKAGGFPGYNKLTHWCGIFQVYLLKKAGVRCRWEREIVDDSGGIDLEISKGKDAQTGLMVGDIVKVTHNQHYLMVLESVVKGYIPGLEGNAGGAGKDKEGNWKKPKLAAYWMGNASYNTVETIEFRYRVIN